MIVNLLLVVVLVLFFAGVMKPEWLFVEAIVAILAAFLIGVSAGGREKV